MVLESSRLCGLVLVAAGLIGCEQPVEPIGFQLSAVSGTYSDGSGLTGLAGLIALRDAEGNGPPEPIEATLFRGEEVAARFIYSETGANSVAAFWWPELLVSNGSEYQVEVLVEGETQRVPLASRGDLPLSPPQLEVASEGSSLAWPAVEGAAAYQCEVTANGALQLQAMVADPGCDLSALPAGTYAASVLALSVDPGTLRTDGRALPLRFDVAEGRYGFVLGAEGGLNLGATALGGAISFGTAQPGIAFWLELTGPDGLAPTESFEVEVVGPGLPQSAPLQFTYPAGAARHLVWSYEVPALGGRYSLVATSASGAISTTVSIAEAPGSLPLPQNVTASEQGTGGAVASWDAVPGAASYYVGIWVRENGQFASGHWTTGFNTAFAPGSLAAGTAYDVYVAAANVDMTSSAAAPLQLSVSENTYSPAGFTTR